MMADRPLMLPAVPLAIVLLIFVPLRLYVRHEESYRRSMLETDAPRLVSLVGADERAARAILRDGTPGRLAAFELRYGEATRASGQERVSCLIDSRERGETREEAPLSGLRPVSVDVDGDRARMVAEWSAYYFQKEGGEWRLTLIHSEAKVP